MDERALIVPLVHRRRHGPITHVENLEETISRVMQTEPGLHNSPSIVKKSLPMAQGWQYIQIKRLPKS
jgi:hypothetical protein